MWATYVIDICYRLIIYNVSSGMFSYHILASKHVVTSFRKNFLYPYKISN